MVLKLYKQQVAYPVFQNSFLITSPIQVPLHYWELFDPASGLGFVIKGPKLKKNRWPVGYSMLKVEMFYWTVL